MYNNFLNKIEDLNNKEYIDEIKDYFIFDTKMNKIYFSQFIEFIYFDEQNQEWHMLGDLKYI